MKTVTETLRFLKSESPGLGKGTSTGRLKGVKVTAQARSGGQAAQSDEGVQQAEGVQQVESTRPPSGRQCCRQQWLQECNMATWEGTFLKGRYRIYLVAER